jgi:putative intracellular protease/amidase
MKIAILVYNGMTMLDAIGPYEVLSNLPDVEIFFVAKKRGDIKADTGFLTIKAKYNFKDVTEADILLIPGSSISFIDVIKDEKTINWIKLIDATTQFTTSVCTGSIILAKAGLLDGLHATSHWKTIPLLKEYHAIFKTDRVVKDGKYITSAGVSAGIDMAIMLCDELVGEDQTRAIQLVLEYDPKPIYNSGNIDTCDEEIIVIANKIMKKNSKRQMGFFKMLSNRKVLKKIK